MKKIILAAVAASIGSSAFAGPLVFSNGVQLTDVQIVERQKEGKLPAIVGNSFYEDGKFVMASDSKNPTVRKVQKVREAIRERQENQDQKRIDRAPAEAARAAAYKAALEAEAARKAAWEALGNTEIEWSDGVRTRFIDGINYSLDNLSGNEMFYTKTEEGKAFVAGVKDIIGDGTGITYAEAEAGWKESYPDAPFDRAAMQQAVQDLNNLETDPYGQIKVEEGYRKGYTNFEVAVDTLRGHVTYALKDAAGIDNFTKAGNDYYEAWEAENK